MGVRGNQGIPGNDEPHKLRGSAKARNMCVRPRAGNDALFISYNAMMSMYPGVSQISTPCH